MFQHNLHFYFRWVDVKGIPQKERNMLLHIINACVYYKAKHTVLSKIDKWSMVAVMFNAVMDLAAALNYYSVNIGVTGVSIKGRRSCSSGCDKP